MLQEAGSEAEKPSILGRFETALIVLVSVAMILLPATAAIARWVAGASLTGALVMTQNLTLWAAFVGALIATGAGSHLALATTEFLPPGRPRQIARFVAYMVTGAVTALLGYATVIVIQADVLKGDHLLGFIPSWWVET